MEDVQMIAVAPSVIMVDIWIAESLNLHHSQKKSSQTHGGQKSFLESLVSIVFTAIL